MRLNPREIVTRLKQNQGKVRQTARELGISPGTVINWRERAKSLYVRGYLRVTGLTRRSTRPRTVRQTALPAQVQDQVSALRKTTHFGAIKLRRILELHFHPRTLHRFLWHKGLIPKQPSYRRPKLQPTIHMHAKNVFAIGYCQMDVKYVTPQLSGLPWTVFEYALIDIYSRYKEALIVPNLDAHASVSFLRVIVPQIPFPVRFIQTDNGLEWQSEFLDYLAGQHIDHHFVHKNSPNENAIIERSFRTDEEEFFAWRYHRAMDLHDLNTQFQEYLHFYNHERPHLGINLMTPIQKMRSLV